MSQVAGIRAYQSKLHQLYLSERVNQYCRIPRRLNRKWLTMLKQLKLQLKQPQPHWQSRIVVNGGPFANRTNHSVAGHAKAIAMCMATGDLIDRVNQLTTSLHVRFVMKRGPIKGSLEIVLFIRSVNKKQWTVVDGSKLDVVIMERMGQWHHQERLTYLLLKKPLSRRNKMKGIKQNDNKIVLSKRI